LYLACQAAGKIISFVFSSHRARSKLAAGLIIFRHLIQAGVSGREDYGRKIQAYDYIRSSKVLGDKQ